MESTTNQKAYQKAIQQKNIFSIKEALDSGYQMIKRDYGTVLVAIIISFVLSTLISIVFKSHARIGNLVSIALLPLSYGLILICQKSFEKQTTKIGDLFEPFKKFAKIFVFTFVYGLVGLVVILPLIIACVVILSPLMSDLMPMISEYSTNPEKAAPMFGLFIASHLQQFGIVFLIFFVYIILIGPLFFFQKYVFFVENESPWESIKGGIKLGRINYFRILGFVFAIIGINILGLLCLGIGLFFTIPLSITASYAVYGLTVPKDELRNENFSLGNDTIISSNSGF